MSRAITRARDKHEAERFVVAAYQQAEDKRIIVMEDHYPARDVLGSHKEPLFVVRPYVDGNWAVETVKNDPRSFKNRKDLPKVWAGKTGAELQKASGIDDAIFCHRNLFLATASSKEGALALAKKALL